MLDQYRCFCFICISVLTSCSDLCVGGPRTVVSLVPVHSLTVVSFPSTPRGLGTCEHKKTVEQLPIP